MVEAVGITEKGTTDTDHVRRQHPDLCPGRPERFIIEMSSAEPPELEGIHDIFIPEDPPYRMPIPIYRAGDRIGKPFIEMEPRRVVAILGARKRNPARFSPARHSGNPDRPADHSISSNMRSKGPPAQGFPGSPACGDVANAVLSGFLDNPFSTTRNSIQKCCRTSVLDLIDLGQDPGRFRSSMTFSKRRAPAFFNELYRYKDRVVLRRGDIHSPRSPRAGRAAINTALELDIYGHVNSTHVMGTHMMNGIGGSGDFERNGSCRHGHAVTARNWPVSSIVPMVSHVDHFRTFGGSDRNRHGLVDTRPLTPARSAELSSGNAPIPRIGTCCGTITSGPAVSGAATSRNLLTKRPFRSISASWTPAVC